jgi:hypothetical protein
VRLQDVRKAGSAAPAGFRAAEFRHGGLAGWLWNQLCGIVGGFSRPAPKLELVERIALGSRHTLALVEAEGRRFLVASSSEGAPAFLALNSRRSGSEGFSRVRVAKAGVSKARISW